MSKALKPQWFQILLTLGDGASHGQEIRDEVLTRTDGHMHLWPGMLYGSLKQMGEEGLVEETHPPADAEHGGGVPRYYALTDTGREQLLAELERLSSFLGAAKAKGLLGA